MLPAAPSPQGVIRCVLPSEDPLHVQPWEPGLACESSFCHGSLSCTQVCKSGPGGRTGGGAGGGADRQGLQVPGLELPRARMLTCRQSAWSLSCRVLAAKTGGRTDGYWIILPCGRASQHRGTGLCRLKIQHSGQLSEALRARKQLLRFKPARCRGRVEP